MPVLIPSSKQPGNDIDVYLKPLVDDLLLLWKENGVCVWDAHTEEHFNLHPLLFVTTNDWPALSNLSGQSNKGYRGCTHYLDKTDSIYLKHYRKIVYMGHHKFLPINYPLWKKHAHYGGMADHCMRPRHCCGKMVFEMVKDIKVVFKKGPGSKSVQSDDGHASMIFPLLFFNIITYLLVHLVKEIGILGLVFLHNMFPFE
jgi:hypothetical protein